MANQEFKADLIIKNGNVVTVNANDEVNEAVAIKDDKIIFTGSNKGAEEFVSQNTTLIDAHGRTVIPGFIDAHLHLGMFGLLDHGVIDISSSKVQSIEDIKELIREAANDVEPGRWIKLQGYDDNKLREKRHPSKEDLDEVAPDNPVQCMRCCCHLSVYNSAALKKIGIIDDSGYAPGEVVMNDNGEPYGLLKETAHWNACEKVEFYEDELIQGYLNADRILMKNGVTSAHDAGGYYGSRYYKVMQEMCNSGRINVRMYPMLFNLFGKKQARDFLKHFELTGVHTGCGNSHFKLGPAKIMLDGSSSGPSSAMIESYSHMPSKGILVWSQEEADKAVEELHREGFQVTAHAVGDMAVTIMVNAIEKAMKKFPRKDCRHRIEHCGITNPELLDKIAELHIIPVSNPSFIAVNGTDYNRFYGERTEYMFALREYRNRGVITAIGSDSPVTDANPMYGFFGALNRRDMKTGEDVGASQRVSLMELIRMYTYNGAYASFEEDVKGSIESGKLADIVILSENVFDCPPEDIMRIKVDVTICGGKVAYSRSLQNEGVACESNQ